MLRGVHSKTWMRIGEGSMPVTRAEVRVRRMEWAGVSVDVVEEDGRRGVSCERRVRVV
jgi:hypothetical protein